MFARLLILFITIPLVELLLFIEIGSRIGGIVPTVGIILATGFLGAWLTRLQGIRTLKRYQQAVTQLVTLGQQKAARLAELRDEARGLQERERQAMAEARREVDRLKAAGKTLPEIRADAGYRRRQAAFEERSAELEELRGRAAALEAETEEHMEKVERHEAQLEALVDEVEDLKSEAAEMVTDMTLTQLEKEIVDVRAGISRAGAGAELESLRRQLRKARAVVRVTREASDLEADADRDEEYLEVARQVEAARRFDDAVGLEGPSREEARERE